MEMNLSTLHFDLLYTTQKSQFYQTVFFFVIPLGHGVMCFELLLDLYFYMNSHLSYSWKLISDHLLDNCHNVSNSELKTMHAYRECSDFTILHRPSTTMFQCFLTLCMLVTSDVYSLINYISFVESLFITMSIAGLLYLRWKLPDATRPIKASARRLLVDIVTSTFTQQECSNFEITCFFTYWCSLRS